MAGAGGGGINFEVSNKSAEKFQRWKFCVSKISFHLWLGMMHDSTKIWNNIAEMNHALIMFNALCVMHE